MQIAASAARDCAAEDLQRYSEDFQGFFGCMEVLVHMPSARWPLLAEKRTHTVTYCKMVVQICSTMRVDNFSTSMCSLSGRNICRTCELHLSEFHLLGLRWYQDAIDQMNDVQAIFSKKALREGTEEACSGQSQSR